MAPRDPQKPESVAELIPRVLEEVGLSDASDGIRLLRAWDRALGPELAPHCRPTGLRRGVVQALVPDSAWMQQLSLEKPRILARLQAALGEPAIDDIRFRIGLV